MEKLIEQIKNLKNSEELPTLGNVKPNELLYAIADTSAFHLLDGLNIRLDLNDKDSLKKLVYHLLDPTDYAVYFLPKHGYYFTKEEQEAIFTIFLQNGLNKESIYKINDFFKYFFKDTNELSTFVSEHKSFFKRYIPLHHYEKTLCKCSPFLEMTLNEGIIAGEVKDYPIASLKLLANLIRKKKIAYQDGNEYVIQRLMAEKDNLELEEVYELFNSFQKTNIVRISKLRKISNKYSTVNLYLQFEDLIRNNIDYLLKMIDKVKDIPRCLKESSLFRDECIKKQRIDLAVQCVLSRDIIQNEELIKAYCQELHISTKDFYNRFQWILDYYKKK